MPDSHPSRDQRLKRMPRPWSRMPTPDSQRPWASTAPTNLARRRDQVPDARAPHAVVGTLFKLLPAGPERELQLLVVAPVGYPPPPNEAKSATVNRPYLITPGQGGCPPCWCLF